jgi:nucleotide-binding universal stress UspA family protein
MNETECLPVVVGVDGSNASLNAAQWAVAEASSRWTALRLVYADEGPGDDGRARRAIDSAQSLVTSCAPTLKVQTAMVQGGAAHVLIAESAHASMVCIGADDRYGTTLGPVAASVSLHAQCPVAIIRDHDDGAGVIGVVLDDSPENDAIVHQAMVEARLRHATVRQVDRRQNSWVRRFPDVRVETVAAGYGPPGGQAPRSSAPARLAVVGRGDAECLGAAVAPNCHPIVGYPDCSVLVIRDGACDPVEPEPDLTVPS